MLSMQSTETLAELAIGSRSGTATNRFQIFWDRLTQLDIFAAVSRHEKLMQMHSTAEVFDAATERLFIPLQVTLC